MKNSERSRFHCSHRFHRKKHGTGMKDMTWRVLCCAAVVLSLPMSIVMWQPSVFAQGQPLVLEDFQAKEADGFPSQWDHENERSQSKGREAYKVRSENCMNFLSAKDAGQRIKKKKIDWDPKAYPVLTWRWRLQKAPADTEPIAAIYAS